MDEAMWQLSSEIAVYSTPQWQFQIRLRNPELGLCDVKLGGTPVGSPAAPWQCLGLGVRGEALTDAYLRGDDLVATYEQDEQQPCRLEVYWRVLPSWSNEPAARAALEMLLSVQTRDLDGDPHVTVASRIPLDKSDGEPRCEREGLLWIPRLEAGFGYLEMVHPSNHAATRTAVEEPADSGHEAAAAVLGISHQFFPGRLEKGVIRRARLRVGWTSAEATEELVTQWFAKFSESPPPLTT